MKKCTIKEENRRNKKTKEKIMAENLARVHTPTHPGNLIDKKTSIKSMLYLNMREM